MGKNACFRLRQSTSGLIEEHLAKLHKARPRDADEAERYLAAQWGDARFTEERAWQLAVRDEWEHVLTLEKARFTDSSEGGGISADDAYAPPAASSAAPPAVPPAFDPDRGKKVLRVGAWLFGIGILSAATGGILVQSRQDSAIVTGLVAFTVAALLSLGGLVCLMVGGILRLHTRSQMRAMGDAGP